MGYQTYHPDQLVDQHINRLKHTASSPERIAKFCRTMLNEGDAIYTSHFDLPFRVLSEITVDGNQGWALFSQTAGASQESHRLLIDESCDPPQVMYQRGKTERPIEDIALLATTDPYCDCFNEYALMQQLFHQQTLTVFFSRVSGGKPFAGREGQIVPTDADFITTKGPQYLAGEEVLITMDPMVTPAGTLGITNPAASDKTHYVPVNAFEGIETVSVDHPPSVISDELPNDILTHAHVLTGGPLLDPDQPYPFDPDTNWDSDSGDDAVPCRYCNHRIDKTAFVPPPKLCPYCLEPAWADGVETLTSSEATHL
jgi:hypothetical protein